MGEVKASLALFLWHWPPGLQPGSARPPESARALARSVAHTGPGPPPKARALARTREPRTARAEPTDAPMTTRSQRIRGIGVARACPDVCQRTPVPRPGMPVRARAAEHTARAGSVCARLQGVHAAVHGRRVGPSPPPELLRRVLGHTINRIIQGHVNNQSIVVFEHTGAK